MKLLAGGAKTIFGRDHGFDKISDYDDFKMAIPIRGYEDLRGYIDKIIAGEKDVLWKGAPIPILSASNSISFE